MKHIFFDDSDIDVMSATTQKIDSLLKKSGFIANQTSRLENSGFYHEGYLSMFTNQHKCNPITGEK